MKYPHLLGSSLVAIALFPLASLAEPTAPVNPIEATAKSITVQVSHSDGGGSAILIGREGNTYTVLTAAHVVCNAVENAVQQCATTAGISLTTPDRNEFIAKEVIVFPSSLDLALIKFTAPFNYPLAKLGDSKALSRHDRLYTTGFSNYGETWQFNSGQVIANSRQRVTVGGHDLVHSAKSLPGMSGGGVFNDRGEVICINSKGSTFTVERMEKALCVPTAFYREFDPQADRTATELYIFAQEEYYKDRYSSAIEYLNRVIAKEPNFLEAHLLKGHAYYFDKKYQLATRSYSQAIALQPRSVEAYFWQGRAEYSLYKYTEALVNFEKAAELKPDSSDAQLWAGHSEYGLGRYEKAIDRYQQAIELKSSEEDGYYWQGRAYAQLKFNGLALTQYSRAIAINPASDALSYRADLYLKEERHEEAIADYTQLIKKDPEKTDAYWQRSTALLASGNDPAALQDIESIIRIDNTLSYSYFRKADIYARMKNDRQAISHYSAFITRFPKIVYDSLVSYDFSTATAYRERSKLYRRQKLYKQAIADLQMAATLYREANSLTNEQACLQIVREISRKSRG
jgi:tetratricopeptide (TPR) repeat protein